MSSLSSASSRPSAIPKEETGTSALLQSNEHADGRGVTVAVLDTGCDLSAAGLQKTSEGKPKYVDFIDCTGGGDIDTSKKVERSADGALVGLSGRNLQLGEWADGVEHFRLGALRLFAMGSMPTSVLRRIKVERKEAFTVQHNDAVSALQRKLDGLAKDDKAARKDVEQQLEQLDEMMKGYEDFGPLLDVVLFQDSSHIWRAVIDTGGNGDLRESTPMAPYKYEHQVGDLGFGSAVSYCVQVYNDGDVLSVVTDAGSHGTHVAGIIAANYDETSHLNGVAPGAQILACKIGDGRLGSAETGTGLVRALVAAKAYQCDLINLSYGEPAWQFDKGRVSDTFTAAVRKWGMSVFTSAGNDGPALSSLGSPGSLSAVITVGAYCSPEMMAEQYSMLPVAEVAGASYSFSSRGPTPDGFLPSICAPGGAIAPVPRHALQGKAQYHGTSMSSPNACGVAACVLSALQQAGIQVQPAELRRALENSAIPVSQSDVFAQGAGLVNAPAAIQYAIAHHGKPGQDVEFELSIPSRAAARGIYLRDASELRGPLSIGVSVRPLFEHAATRTAEELDELLKLELELELRATADWVTTPSSLFMLSAKERGAQNFAVRLDPGRLAPGAHFARVQAFDVQDPERGPLFSLPVTVIIPHTIAPTPLIGASSEPIAEDFSATLNYPITLHGGVPVRRFISVPDVAEWATVKLSTKLLPEGPHAVIVHAVPSARGDLPNTECQTKRMIQLREDSNEELQVPVRGSSTLELCLQLSWLSNPAPAKLEAAVEFHSHGLRGPAMFPPPMRIGNAQTFSRFEVNSPLRTERVSPKGKLTVVERALVPTEHTIIAGSAEQDVMPPSDAVLRADPEAKGTPVHSMVLTYKFEVAPEGDAKEQKVVPRVASLHNQLYDSPLDSMLWRLEDSNGQTLGYGGAMHEAAEASLRKGSYKISVLLRHPDRAQLLALKALPLMLRMPLASPLDCPIYSGRGAASSMGHGGAKTTQEYWLRRGGHSDLYVCRPTGKVPSWVGPGDVLVGRLLIDEKLPGVTARALAVEMHPQPAKAAEKDSAGNNTDKNATKTDEEIAADDVEALKKAIFKAKLDRLSALRKEGASSTRFDAVLGSFDEDKKPLELLLEVLKFKQSVSPPSDMSDEAVSSWRASEIRSAADALKAPSGPIDTASVAQYFGLVHDTDDSVDNKDTDKRMKEERAAVRIALLWKAHALSDCLLPSKQDGSLVEAFTKVEGDTVQQFNEAVAELKQWVENDGAIEEDADKDKLALTLMRYELVRGKPGAALSILRARLKAVPPGAQALTKESIHLYRSLELETWATNAEEAMFAKYPVVKLPL